MSALFDFERLTNDDYVKQSLLLASLVPRLSPMAPHRREPGYEVGCLPAGRSKSKTGVTATPGEPGGPFLPFGPA
jgi:hypothetical protein